MKVPRNDSFYVKNQTSFRKQKRQSHNSTQQDTSYLSYSRTIRNFANVTDYYVRKGSRVST